MQKILPLDGCANLLHQFVKDFYLLSRSNFAIPNKCFYKVASSLEPSGIARSARMAALSRLSVGIGIFKYAFDARRTDQDSDRNPRHNLQYYNRSQQYIDEEDQKRLERFARLIGPLEMIKTKFGEKPEYFHSYARKLHEDIKSILKVTESDMDVFRPQMDYLEQLLFARYRISTEDLEKAGADLLRDRLLSKDEDLLKRGSFMHITGDQNINNNSNNGIKSANLTKDGDKTTQENIINAIFGNNNLRRDGEKVVERTITITIKDQVID